MKTLNIRVAANGWVAEVSPDREDDYIFTDFKLLCDFIKVNLVRIYTVTEEGS